MAGDGSEDHQQRRLPTVVLLIVEIVVLHSSFVFAWRFLWPYVSHYVPDCQPLLDVIWTHVLEPYAISLFSIPSAVVLVIMLCYTAAKYFAKDIFNAEAEPLTRFVMTFKEDMISMQDIEELRYHLHSCGVLSLDEMSRLSQSTVPNRYKEVYDLLLILDQKSSGPFKLIKVLQEMATEHNFLGEIANTLRREYSNDYAVASVRNCIDFLSSHEPPGIDTHTMEVITMTSKSEKIKWAGRGLTLNISNDAIAKDGRTVQLQLGVGFMMNGQINIPFNGQFLLSPLYYLSIRGGRLSKPIKAEVQHCGELNGKQDGDMLTFLTADATKRTCTEVSYEMMPQYKSTSFSSMSTSGTIDLHESLLKGANPSVIFTVCSKCRDVLSRYCVRIFYQFGSIYLSSKSFAVHVTVIKDLETCSKLLDEVYPACEWYSEPNETVTVCLKDSFAISLDEQVRFGGWKIAPTSPLNLSKDYLESIKIYGLKKIPHISLQLAWVGSSELDMRDPVLSYGLTVQGTTEPHLCTSLYLKLPCFHRDARLTVPSLKPPLPKIPSQLGYSGETDSELGGGLCHESQWSTILAEAGSGSGESGPRWRGQKN